MPKDKLFNKFEILIHRDDTKIIYDDITGSIIYWDNKDGSLVTIDLPNTLSVIDIYKKMELICISLNLPKTD